MTNRLRITIVLPFAGMFGGIRVALTYALLLREMGHLVTVVAQPRSTVGWKRRVKDFLRGRKPVVMPLHPLVDDLGSDFRLLETPRPVVDHDVPDGDVVMATWWETAEWVARLSQSKGRKFYLLQDYEVFPGLPHDRVVATFSLGLKMIAVSSYIRSEVLRHVPHTPVAVVNNSVDLQLFSAGERHQTETGSIGFLYSTAERKNVGLAIEIVRRIKEMKPATRIVAFGSAPPRPPHSLPDWIEFVENPPQDRIAGIYAACDVWLFTSEKEGFGLPILEAFACGTPVLATRAGAAPDLIDGTNGRLLDQTPEAFVTAICDVLDMAPKDWKAMSDAARSTARQWTWHDAASAMVSLLASPRN